MKTTSLLLLGTALTLSASAADEQTISLDKLPAPASQTIQKRSAGAKIEKVSRETDHGKTVYEARFKNKDGRIEEISVDATGKLVSDELTITIADAPKPVRAAIESAAAGGKIEKLERVNEAGKTTYEALISSKKKREEIVFSPDGKIVEREDKTREKDKD